MLVAKTPARPREPMKENERWAGHIVYLTITATLAAALIAAVAALFSDPAKIVGPTAKSLILLSALTAFATLVAALFASVWLSNYLVWADQNSSAQRRKWGSQVTTAAGAAFSFLFISSALLAAFFAWVTLSRPPERSIQTPIVVKSDPLKDALEATKVAVRDAQTAEQAALQSATTAQMLLSTETANLQALTARVYELQRQVEESKVMLTKLAPHRQRAASTGP